ncbi:unnamed protein product [Rhizophagus irregularis]|nr:unnamed protein product [Rhizophagus irregularis]
MVRMKIEEDGTMIHKDIMVTTDTQTINVKMTNKDTTRLQDQTKRHYIDKGGLESNTNNTINSITNKGSVMDITELTNQDMDVDSQMVSEEENKKERIDKKHKEKSKKYNKKSKKVIIERKTKKEISTINICTFNARGINDTKKQESISQLIQIEEWDIANINETKLTTRKGEFAFNNIKKEFRSIVNSTNDTNNSIVSDIEKSLKSKYTNTRNFTDEDWESLAEQIESDVNKSIEFLLDEQQNKDIAWEFIVNSFQTNKNKLIEDKLKEKRSNNIMEEEEQYILDYNNKRNDVIILKKIVKIIEITKKRISNGKIKKHARDTNTSDRKDNPTYTTRKYLSFHTSQYIPYGENFCF